MKTFFKRNEKKYLLDKNEFEVIKQVVDANMKPDKYFKSTINNVYFDTPKDELVVESIMSPDYKYKVRARSYGSPKNSKVFLEIKSKLMGTVYKRRVELSLEEYNKYLTGKYMKNEQVMKELDYIFHERQLSPKLFMSYDRSAYSAKDDSDLRITFDEKLRSRLSDVKIENTSNCKEYFDQDIYIMEIKSREGMPSWLREVLAKNQIYSSSFSKYGKIYQKNLEERKMEIVHA